MLNVDNDWSKTMRRLFALLLLCTIVFQSIACTNEGKSDTEEIDIHAEYAKGDAEALAAIITDSPEHIDQQDEHGNTVLMLAIDDQRDDVVELLLVHDAELNVSNVLGNTPLAFACLRGDLPLIRRLLDLGADPNYGQGSALAKGVATRRTDVCKILLEANADPLVVYKSGGNPIDHAEKLQFDDIAKLLRQYIDKEPLDGDQ